MKMLRENETPVKGFPADRYGLDLSEYKLNMYNKHCVKDWDKASKSPLSCQCRRGTHIQTSCSSTVTAPGNTCDHADAICHLRILFVFEKIPQLL